MDHLYYPLKLANLKGKSIQNILREKVEPTLERQHLFGSSLYGTTGVGWGGVGGMIAGNINRAEDQIVNQICWVKAVG